MAQGRKKISVIFCANSHQVIYKKDAPKTGRPVRAARCMR